MDLSSIDTATLQTWQGQLLAAINTGQRLSSASYTQGDGSRSVNYLLNGNLDQRAALARIERELRHRGVVIKPPQRRRLGIRF